MAEGFAKKWLSQKHDIGMQDLARAGFKVQSRGQYAYYVVHSKNSRIPYESYGVISRAPCFLVYETFVVPSLGLTAQRGIDFFVLSIQYVYD